MMSTTMESTYHQDIAQAATEVLANSPVSELRQLRVDGTDTGLTVSGSVRSFYHKQLAQETIRSVADGTPLVNLVDVSR